MSPGKAVADVAWAWGMPDFGAMRANGGLMEAAFPRRPIIRDTRAMTRKGGVRPRIRRFLRRLVFDCAARMAGARGIRCTGKIVRPDADFSLHMLTCHRHVDMALWSLKSFTHFAGQSPHLMIHDDGTLTAEDKDILHRVLHRCVVVDREEADDVMSRKLGGLPRCLQMRARADFHCARKLMDVWLFARTDMMMLLDSDILFFRTPAELLTHLQASRPCFGSDYQDMYAATSEDLRRRMGIAVLPAVNAGLVIMRRADGDLALMEEYFARFPEPVRDVNCHEQTLHALLLSRCQAHRLGPAYQISRQRIDAETVSHHFVNDGSRAGFFTRGVRALKGNALFAAAPGQSGPEKTAAP